MMATSTGTLCSPCDFKHLVKAAELWCKDCKEAFCKDCSEHHTSTKALRNHKLISIGDVHLGFLAVETDHRCSVHQQPLDFYCSSHDDVICVLCVKSPAHASCKNPVPISDVAVSSESSTALNETETSITETVDNVEMIIELRNKELDNLSKQETETIERIREIRRNINQKLDLAEKKSLQDLKAQRETKEASIQDEISKLQNIKSNTDAIKTKVLNIKQFASSVDLFRGIRQMDRELARENSNLQNIVANLNSYSFSVNASEHVNVCNILSKDEPLTDVNVNYTPVNFTFKQRKIKEAQLHVFSSRNPLKAVNDVNVHLKNKFRIQREGKGIELFNCTVLGDNFIYANFYSKRLVIHDRDGNHKLTIKVSAEPFDLTKVDANRIAVTFPLEDSFQLINIETEKAEEVKFKRNCYGITFDNGNLYICVMKEGILVATLTGQITRQISVDIQFSSYIITDLDRIYYTNWLSSTIHCCDKSGREFWNFKNEHFEKPHGLASDSKSFIFMSCHKTDNILILSRDGKTYQELLSAKEGLDWPSGLCYDATNDVLVVCTFQRGKNESWQYELL